ncbi:MAG: hypothetical protein IPJ14_21170 [Kineosporiaceae bacterium]|nr:hypothetical protein [Kineosporiaceae bacterium]MBK7625102.1 hypothetical protein [Kineosporiaceae bacterium]
MDPEAIIEGYVRDVVRHLPRSQRQDVGFELRSLLLEDLAGRAADTGRPADAAMTMELLTAFGRPLDVADRYRPSGFTVIRPADAPRFAWVALGGVLVQWAITLPVVLRGGLQAEGTTSWAGRLASWWLTWGLGAFWWPGFLIALTLVAAAVSSRRADQPWTPPRALDRDQVHRPGMVLALTFWVVGATILIALPWLDTWAPGLPQPVLEAFAFTPDFLRERAPWVLLLWAIDFGLYAAVLRDGRWNRQTRRLALATNLGWLVLLSWWLFAGRIFRAEAAEDTVRFGLLVVVVIVVVDVVATTRRHLTAIRPPAA